MKYLILLLCIFLLGCQPFPFCPGVTRDGIIKINKTNITVEPKIITKYVNITKEVTKYVNITINNCTKEITEPCILNNSYINSLRREVKHCKTLEANLLNITNKPCNCSLVTNCTTIQTCLE